MLQRQADDRLMAQSANSAETSSFRPAKPCCFLLAIRSTKHVPRKRTEVKRIARNEQLGLTSGSGVVHSSWPD
jgi:hypothetical protein